MKEKVNEKRFENVNSSLYFICNFLGVKNLFYPSKGGVHMRNYTPLNLMQSLTQEILELLNQGKTMLEIAHELGKSRFECEWLINNIHIQNPSVEIHCLYSNYS